MKRHVMAVLLIAALSIGGTTAAATNWASAIGGATLPCGLASQPSCADALPLTLCPTNLTLNGSADAITDAACDGDLTSYPAYLSAVESLVGHSITSGDASVITVTGANLDLSLTPSGVTVAPTPVSSPPSTGSHATSADSLFLIDTYDETATPVAAVTGSGGVYAAVATNPPVPQCANCSTPPQATEPGSVLPATGGAWGTDAQS